MITENKYAKGRLSVIKEMRVFLNKKIYKLTESDFISEYGQIAKGGVIKGFKTILRELEVKENNILKNLKIETHETHESK